MRKIIVFYTLAFSLPWAVQAAVILSGGFTSGALIVLYGLGWLSPSIAAGVMVHREGGGPAVRALFGQLLRWRITPLYLVALAVPTLARLAGHAATYGHGPWLQLAFSLSIVGPPLVEEPGWRGYALPRLQRLVNPAVAAAIVGLLWAVWHLPLFFIPGGPPPGMLPAYLTWVTAAGIVSAGLYNASGRLLTAAVVFHVGLNLGLVPLGDNDARSFALAAVAMSVVAAAVAVPLARGDWNLGGKADR